MEGTRKLKPRVARREPLSMERIESFAEDYVKAISNGDLDRILDILWTATDERLRQYFQEKGDADKIQQSNAEKVRRMRLAPDKLYDGNYYNVFGDQNVGVIVRYLGMADLTEVGGVPKAKVLVVSSGKSNLEVGKVYKIPTGALEESITSQSELRILYGK